MIRLPTVGDLETYHELAIEEFGGEEGIRDPAGLQAVVGSLVNAQRYTCDVFELAAAAVLYLNQRHPFLDGNKRVSAQACIRILSWNGVATGHSTKRLEVLILAVADQTNTRSRDSIADELRTIYG